MVEFLIFAFIGLFAGGISGILGIGGAVFIIPALVTLLKFDQKNAQGTSLAMMIPPVGLLAAITYYQGGYVNMTAAIAIALSFFPGGLIGAKIANKMRVTTLKRIFALFLIIFAIILFLK